ncbi:MAG: hypothetical protein BGO77_01430 [Caedibacter sp. 37-49]|nr:MAG: hypothetical protein BGO77_01430 [Caedibacter sp. 37-49]
MGYWNNKFTGQEVMEQHNSKAFILRDNVSLESLPTNDNKSPKNERIKRIIIGMIILATLVFLALL